MSSPILGIDLGTTNSVVAVADGTEVRALADELGRRLVPSTVSFHPDGSILVGHDARDRRLVDASNTVFSTKRLIGRPFSSVEVKKAAERFPFVLEPTPTGGVQVRVRRGTYTLPEISAFVLRYVRTMAEQAIGQPCRKAVITVPANFNELQRSATQAAAKIAGLEVVRMINEPTAATLAYGLGKDGAERVLVYDLGGGTFDVTVLDLDKEALEVVSTAGDTFLGGDDFDLLLAERMADACLRQHRFDPRTDVQTFERLRAAAEWAKCQLSVVPEVELAVEELFHEAGGRAVNFVYQAKRTELEQQIRPLVSRTFDVVNDALRACGRRPKEIDTVVLVGGSTRIPMIMQMVGEFFTQAPRFERDPDLVVAQGAALQAYTLGGRTEPARSVARPPVPRPPAPLRAKEKLPKQPAFAPPEPSRTVPEPSRTVPEPTRVRTDAGLGDRPRTDPGLGERPRTDAGIGPRRPGGGDTTRTTTNPGLSETGTAIARVQIKRVTDDRQARAVESPDASLPPLRHSQAGIAKDVGGRPRTEPGVTGSHSLMHSTLGQSPLAVAPTNVAVVRPVTVGTPARPSLTQLDSVDDELTSVGKAPEKPDKKWRKSTILGAASPLPVTPNLAADAPFEIGSKETTLPAKFEDWDDEPTRVGKPPERPEPPAPQRPLAPAQPPRPPRPDPRAEPPTPVSSSLLNEIDLPLASELLAAPPAPPPPPPPPPPPASRSAATTMRGDGPLSPPIKRDITSWSPEPPSSPAIPMPTPPAAPQLGSLFSEPPAQMRSPGANVVAGVPHQPAIPMPAGRAPLLMDVTPLALGIETVGGYCQHLVNRNAPVPTEKTRVFATGRDDQTEVEIRICQGDSNLFGDNEALGVISLLSLRRAKRGDVRIEVTFMLDASGVLDVRATDLDTKRAQVTRIQLKGGLAAGEVDTLRSRQERELGGSA